MKKRKCRFAFVGNRFPITGFSGVHFRINSYGTSASFQVKISDPEFADLFYAYGVLDSGRFIGESSYLVWLRSNQASFYLRA